VVDRLIILEVKPKLRKLKPKPKVLISLKIEDQVLSNLDMFHHSILRSNHTDSQIQGMVKKD
jgi:hypothetical protein